MSLIAQVDLTQVPPPSEDIKSWWPVIMIVVSVIISAVSAAWTTYITFREKKLDHAREDVARRVEIEVERMRLESERQKEFQNDLMGQCKELMAENQRTRDSLAKAHSHLIESHAQVNDQQARNKHQAEEIIELRATVRMLEEKIDRLEKHVARLENTEPH